MIANPNAPTGIGMRLESIEKILTQNPGIVVIVDEAYVDFGGESTVELVRRFENLVVLQTFSKSRILAGLRVRFAIAQPHLIEALQRLKDSFNSYPVGRLALEGARAAWADHEWFDKTRQRVIADRDRMSEGLKAIGFRVLPSATNFIFAAHASIPGEKLFVDLRSEGILVRHFSHDRTKNWLRISVGTSQDFALLLESTQKNSRGICQREPVESRPLERPHSWPCRIRFVAAQELPAALAGDDFTILDHHIAAREDGDRPAGAFNSFVGRVVHIVVQVLVCDGDLLVRVPNRDIGVRTNGDGAFAGMQSIEFCGIGRG